MARRKVEIHLALRDEKRAVVGYETPCRFLVAHRPIGTDGELDTRRSVGWKVSHKPTGLGCGAAFDTLQEACDYSERLGELIDLGFTSEKQRDSKALGEANRRAREYASMGKHIIRGPCKRSRPRAPRKIAAKARLPEPVPRNRRLATVRVGTVVPAYGRDYTSAAGAKADFFADRDFLICNIMDPGDGKPINRSQITPGTRVGIRYARLTKQTFVEA